MALRLIIARARATASASVSFRLQQVKPEDVKPGDFTPLAHQALLDASKVAIQHHQNYIEPECLMLSLLYQDNGIAGKVLEDLDVDPAFIKIMILEFLKHQPQAKGSLIADYLDKAANFFHGYGYDGISTSIKTVEEFFPLPSKDCKPRSHLTGFLQESKINMIRTGDTLVGEEHFLMSYANDPRLGDELFKELRITDRCIGYAAQRVLGKTGRIVGYTGQRGFIKTKK